MKARHVVLAALVAAVTMTSVAAAGPSAAKQRVAITMKDLPNGTFVLSVMQAGSLKGDSGTTSVVIPNPVVVMREGQRVEIYSGTTFTLKGRQGGLTIRERIDWVDTGGPYIGYGTWKVVRGTGQYVGIAGGGRTAAAGLDRAQGDWYVREEGFLTLP